MAQFVCNYISKVLGRAITVNVIVPSPAFGEASASYSPEAPFPVLYLIAGEGSDENSWMRYTSIERYAEENRIAVVMCPVENTAGLDQTVFIPFGKTQPYSDPDNRFIDIRDICFSRLITEELVAFVSGYFPVSNHADDMYLAGQGEGAFTSLLLAARTGNYAAVGAFGCCAADLAPLLDAYTKKGPADQYRPPIVFLADRFENSTTDLRMKLTEFGICVQNQHIPAHSEWELCDKAVQVFLEQLPRKDHYASLKKRRL